MKTTEGETYPWLHSFQRDVFDVCVQYHTGYLESELKEGPFAKEIARSLAERYKVLYQDEDVGELNHGRIYPALDGLVERGLLKRIEGRRDNKVPYQVTDDGMRYAIRFQQSFYLSD